MAAGGGATTSRSLQVTPTWAVATVCFIFISFSILIEHLIHLLGNWLKRKRKTALFEAVEGLKTVLIVLGFMSLILTVSQRWISKICIPNKIANTMLPCRQTTQTKTTKALAYHEHVWIDSLQGRRLAASDDDTSGSSDYCASKGMTSLISQEGLNQLSIFIFVLAVMQIVYCVLTMALGRAKMKRWKTWERETETVEYLAANDPDRFRYARQTTFARRHISSFTSTALHLWIKCFFNQFFNSVAKVDYLTLRHGFISAHLSTNSSFNFQKYIHRSLEDDFKVIVGISPFMWFLVVILMLLDVQGWNVYLWVSFIPLTIVLVLGTKLQVIVARMALQLKDDHNVIKGAPLVHPNDNFFWFNNPEFVLTLLHYTLFVNAFEIAFLVWVTLLYGIHSCYHERLDIIIIRAVLAVTVQVLCSYITLPLYALVTQMGSHFKKALLEEQTANAIKRWHDGVKHKRKKQQDMSQSGHDMSSTNFSSNRTLGSLDLSYHHRTPILSDPASFPGKTEIIEGDQEISQDGLDPAIVTSNEIQIERN
ncbi:MLO-like protein 3 [Pistacia vera]|uniref:MLO-like protein 3 n=1 Tax=Pistacia vera TaxID=55513 RepID=UPI001262F8EE|nr:MLO-like protein 3 [Pistacia vera]